MNIGTQTARDAIHAAGYGDMISDIDDGRLLLSVLDTEAPAALAAVRRMLPSGWTAGFTGASNTDEDGDTVEDIEVRCV